MQFGGNMPLIANIDGASRRIFLSADTVGIDLNPIDIYKEMRTLRRLDEDLRKWNLFMSASGNVPKGGGKFTERLVTLLNGTRIVPFDTDHELTVVGTVITDDGQEGIAAFDRSSLDINTTVDINYVPPQVEVIEVVVGTGGGTGVVDLSEVLTAINNLNNFNPASDIVAQVSLVDTTTNLTNGGAGSTPPSVDDISDAVWNKLLADMSTAGSAGERLTKLLTLNKYLGLS